MTSKYSDRRSRSERLNFIIERMRTQKDLTPLALAEELNVSPRTVYRDLQHLEKQDALQKRYSRREGRYIFEEELILPPLRLTASEGIALLKAACNPALSRENFHASDLQSGLRKICQAISPELRRNTESDTEEDDDVPLTLPSLSADALRQPVLEKIRRGIHSNRKLILSYWPTPGTSECTVTIAPYDLRAIEQKWYLLGKTDKTVRLFPLNRIRKVELLSEHFRFPRHFSADALFARTWQTAGDSDVETVLQIRFAPALAATLSTLWASQSRAMEIEADGSLLCTMAVHSGREILWWVLSYGDQAELLSPPELRAELAAIAHATAALYPRDSGTESTRQDKAVVVQRRYSAQGTWGESTESA